MEANQTKRKVGADLTEGPILRLLLTFAIPMVLSSLIQQLYSMVDLMVIGRFVGSVGTVAVSTGGEFSDFFMMIAVAFSTAGQIYIAQLAGAKDRERIRKAVGTLFTVSLLVIAVFTSALIIFHRPLLALINCPEEAYADAADYLIITAAGLPFIFGYNALCAVLRSMGESKRPMYFVTIAAVINIVLDLLLVAVFDMGAAGTAIATAASQAGAFIASYLFLLKNRDYFCYEQKLSYFRIDGHSLKVMMILGIPQLIRSLSVNGSMLWVKANINAFGVTASAAYSIGNKIEKFMNIFIYGVDGAGGAMVGQNLGARKLDRVKGIIWKSLGITFLFSVAAAVLFLTVPGLLYGIFTTDGSVIQLGAVFLRIMSVGCIVVAFSCAFKSMATGAGAAGLCLAIGVVDGVSRVLVCLFFSGVLHQGVQSYFWGAALCQLLPGIMSLIYYLSGKWKTKKLLADI